VLATAACALATPARAAAGEPARYTVTLSLSEAQVTAGSTVTYSGGVRTAGGARAAGTVTVQKRPATGGAWSAWRKVALRSDGSFAVSVAMTTAGRVWQFRARMRADGGANLAGVSPVRTLTVTAPAAPYAVTLDLSAAQVTAGATVTYSGSVRTAAGAPVAGAVIIQKRLATGGAWSAWRKVALSADGSYAVSVAMTTADRVWQVRARMPADGGANLAGVSPVRTLAVTAASASSVVEIAQRYLGVPYVWGGASPTGFDCSGLVMYCYAQVGVSLQHGATWQQQACTPVPLDAIQPGDLVFFGSPGAYGHVGIYVGGGTMIDAPHTGAVVRYDAITGAACAGRP
jgi:cell wall-associated NlpC family hydrolase